MSAGGQSVSGCVSLCSGKMEQRPLWGVCVSLSAVNLTESAEGKMSVSQQIQIYVTAAISLRAALGKHLSCLPVSTSICSTRV